MSLETSSANVEAPLVLGKLVITGKLVTDKSMSWTVMTESDKATKIENSGTTSNWTIAFLLKLLFGRDIGLWFRLN